LATWDLIDRWIDQAGERCVVMDLLIAAIVVDRGIPGRWATTLPACSDFASSGSTAPTDACDPGR